jgi:hypothetical protein
LAVVVAATRTLRCSRNKQTTNQDFTGVNALSAAAAAAASAASAPAFLMTEKH